MRYDEFCDRLQECLCEAGLFFQHADRPIETIDLANSDRRWKVYIGRSAPQKADPFFVSNRFRWDLRAGSFAKRTSSRNCSGERSVTQDRARLVRVDLNLYATFHGSTTPCRTRWSWRLDPSIGEKLESFQETKGVQGILPS
jgi:hypothetical protein